jgi:hypothetical protein
MMGRRTRSGGKTYFMDELDDDQRSKWDDSVERNHQTLRRNAEDNLKKVHDPKTGRFTQKGSIGMNPLREDEVNRAKVREITSNPVTGGLSWRDDVRRRNLNAANTAGTYLGRDTFSRKAPVGRFLGTRLSPAALSRKPQVKGWGRVEDPRNVERRRMRQLGFR